MAYKKINSASTILPDNESELFIAPCGARIIGRRLKETPEQVEQNRIFIADTINKLYERYYGVSVSVTFSNNKKYMPL